jgi:hypothetical protein
MRPRNQDSAPLDFPVTCEYVAVSNSRLQENTMTTLSKRSETQMLLKLVDESYISKAWHGPNLRGSLRGITVEEAAWRPSPNRHNIWEIIVHCAYWKYIVRRRILRETRGSFPYKGSNWFKRPIVLTREALNRDLRILKETHQSMVGAISSLNYAELRRIPKNSKVSNEAIVRGIASHDVYHAGQIQLLKRLMK